MASILRQLPRASTASSSLFASTSGASRRSFSATAARPLARMTVLGNLGDTPELAATSTGREVLRYAVASHYGRGEKSTTSWFHVTFFDPPPGLKTYLLALPRGSQVYVEADAGMTQYTDEQGKPKYRLSLIQRHIEVLRRPRPYGEGEQGELEEDVVAEK